MMADIGNRQQIRDKRERCQEARREERGHKRGDVYIHIY